MERLKELISQLTEQVDHQAEPAEMLQTTQLLEAELRILASQPPKGRVRPTKIAVMMPSAAKISPAPPAEALAKAAASAAEPAARATVTGGEAPAKALPSAAAANVTAANVTAANVTATNGAAATG